MSCFFEEVLVWIVVFMKIKTNFIRNKKKEMKGAVDSFFFFFLGSPFKIKKKKELKIILESSS